MQYGEEPGKSPSVAVVDGHVDLLYHMMTREKGVPFERCRKGPVTLEQIRRGGIRILGAAFYCPDAWNGPEKAAGFLSRLFEYWERYVSGLFPIRSVSDLVRSFEGTAEPGCMFLLENADALVDAGVDWVVARGVRVVGLTHAGANRIGQGNGVERPRGLTPAGRRVLRDLEAAGCAVDLAHLSDPCFWEVLERFEGPVCSSHTGFRTFCRIPRNLDTDQVEALVARGAVIGITVNPEMLSPDCRADAEDVFRRIDWFVQAYGADGLGLGSDFGGFNPVTRGLEDASRLSDLAVRMEDAGYPQEAVYRILGENWVRFYRGVLEGTASRERETG